MARTIMGWVYDARNGVWRSPDGKFVADKTPTGQRWEIWFLTRAPTLTGATRISRHNQSLRQAIELLNYDIEKGKIDPKTGRKHDG